MKRKLLGLILVVAAIVTLGLVKSASASCVRNVDSDLMEIDGYTVCAGHGGGCDVCVSRAGRSPGAFDLCYFSVASGDWSCTYFY